MNNSLFHIRKQCPTCASEKFSDIYRSKYTSNPVKSYLIEAYGHADGFDLQHLENIDYSLLQCDKCDLIFQEYIPTPDFMAEIYGHWADAQKELSQPPNYGISYYSIYSQDILQILAYLGKVPATVKILDFGMGWGRWALMAKAFGCEVYGVELSSQRLEYAKANGIQPILWSDIPNYQFDLIHTDQVFEHLAEPVQVLNHLKQSLKSDGLIKICVPNSFGMRYRLKKMDWAAPKGSLQSLNPVAPLEHINCFYRESMLKLAQGSDLLEVKIPIHIQYRYTTVWDKPKRVLRNLVMPIYRNILGLQNYYLFKQVVL